MAKTDREEIEQGLAEDFSQPATTVRRKQIKETTPISPRERQKAPEVDPWEKEKEKYRVNLADLLKIEVPVLIKEDPARLDMATRYLLWDNYFDKLLIEEIEALSKEGIDQPLLSGEEQIIYFWFYRMSYGYGYSACGMSQKVLARKLKWSVNKVKRCLRSLKQKEIIRPVLGPFKNKRPTVYGVVFPQGATTEIIKWHP